MVISGRRALVTTIGAFLIWPSSSFSEDTGRARRTVAYLSSTSVALGGHLVIPLNEGLRDHGWVEGTNLTLHTRFADGDSRRYAPLTSELLALRPDAFVVGPERVALAAAASTSKLPIVFILGDDPVSLGLVESLAKPGRNVTGLSVVNFEINAKRLAFLKEAVPHLTKVGALFKGSDRAVIAALGYMEQAGQALGISIVPVVVSSSADIAPAIQKIAASGATGLTNVPDALFFTERYQLADLAKRYRLAAASAAIEAVEAGTLLAYSADYSAMFRRAADLIDRILKGANPANMPVEQANAYGLVVNRATARALGIELPNSLLLQAKRVIE